MLGWVGVLRVCGGVLGVVFNKCHLLSVLLSLVIVDLGLFLGGLVVFSSVGAYEMRVVIIGVGACSRAIGIGALIGFSRVSGSDFTGSSLRLKV